MKMKNIFKKENKTVAKATIETLAKTQLEKVIGGVDSGINTTNGSMPNRISMNVTVAKQTQGSTFGEKVNAG